MMVLNHIDLCGRAFFFFLTFVLKSFCSIKHKKRSLSRPTEKDSLKYPFALSFQGTVAQLYPIPAMALISRIILPIEFFPIGTLLNQISPLGLCFGVR